MGLRVVQGTYSDGRSQLLKLDKRAENLEGANGSQKVLGQWIGSLTNSKGATPLHRRPLSGLIGPQR